MCRRCFVTYTVLINPLLDDAATKTELEELTEKRKELRIPFMKTLNRIENKLEDQIRKSEII